MKIFWSSILHLVCLCVCTFAALIEECPHPEDTFPCICDEIQDKWSSYRDPFYSPLGPTASIHCGYLHRSKQFVDVFRKLTNYKAITVTVTLYTGETIKPRAFAGPAISEIIFSQSNLVLASPQFIGQDKSLKRVIFYDCFSETDMVSGSFDRISFSLAHLERLSEMVFENNDIPILRNNWLKATATRLSYIVFDKCNIEMLEDRVFEKVTNLGKLSLKSNRIKSISRSMFPASATKLGYIYLNDNKIEKLPRGIFEDMPRLMQVHLQRNNLKTFKESVWSSVLQPNSVVHLEGNPFICDHKLKWITKKPKPYIFEGECSAPANLTGKALRNLKAADLE